MSLFSVYKIKYVGIFLVLELINFVIFEFALKFEYKDSMKTDIQFVFSILATIAAALFITRFFYNKQKNDIISQKRENKKKFNSLVLLLKKNMLKGNKILPTEEDFDDNFDESFANMITSLLFMKRIQNIVYGNTDFISYKNLSKLIPVLSDVPIINKRMSEEKILKERANLELTQNTLLEIISDKNFCDNN